MTFVMSWLRQRGGLDRGWPNGLPRPYNGRMGSFVDKLVVLACCAACVVVLGATGAGRSAPDGVLVAMMLAAAIVAFVPDFAGARRPEWASRGLAFGRSAAYCVGALIIPAGVAFLPLMAYVLARREHPAAALVAAVPLAVHASAGALSAPQAVVVMTLGALSALAAARAKAAEDGTAQNRRTRDALQERTLELEAANRELTDRQEREARLAVLEERGRIAREIHDNVGHLLTRSILLTEAYQVVHAEDERVRSEFSQVGGVLHEALDTVRASVHGLRDDSVDLSVQMAAIVEGSAVPVKSDISVESAPPEVAACLTAVVREALSNTARHSDATRVDVALVEHPGLWQLSVRDDGSVPPAPDALHEGMGLHSMEERVRRLGGTFRCGYRDGFEVFASIPKASGGRKAERGGAGAVRTKGKLAGSARREGER